MSIKKITYNICDQMREQKMSILETAKQIGVHRNTLAAYLNNPGKMPVDKFYAIAQALGVSVNDLMKGVTE